jgi:putative transposase
MLWARMLAYITGTVDRELLLILRNEYLATENRILRAQFKGRKLIAGKFDGSTVRKSRGRPRVDEETERLVVRMAKENPGWGYDRIGGAMAKLGLRL